MSWKVKSSSTTQFEERDSWAIPSRTLERWSKEILPRYERKQGALVPILHEIQQEHRCIPYQSMVEVARLLEITPAEVLDTVSFYEELTVEPTGKHVIGVCQSIACEVCGHQMILDHVRQKLDLEPHETSDDGKFTLLAMECLGSCDTAPVALVNDTLHENLTIERLDEIIDGLE